MLERGTLTNLKQKIVPPAYVGVERSMAGWSDAKVYQGSRVSLSAKTNFIDTVMVNSSKIWVKGNESVDWNWEDTFMSDKSVLINYHGIIDNVWQERILNYEVIRDTPPVIKAIFNDSTAVVTVTIKDDLRGWC